MKTCNGGSGPQFPGIAHLLNHEGTPFSPQPQQSETHPGQLSIGRSSMDFSRYSLEELVQQYHLTGSKMAFSELYKRFSTLVLGSCINYLKDPILAKDAASDIFLDIHRKLRRTRPVAFRAWLYTVTRNHCLQIMRSNGRKPHLEPLSELKGASEPRVHDKKEEKLPGLKNAVRLAMEGLPERQRECITMFMFQSLRYKEISEETGWTLNEVKSHIQNGKRNLRLVLGDFWRERGFAG